MKTYSYNKELLIATAQFKDVFNNIQIFRFDNADAVTDTIDVPIKYGSRSIAIKSIVDPKKNVLLPVISFNRTGLSVDPERLFNFNNDLLTQPDGDKDPTLNHPIPVSITFELFIYTMYPDDDDQIIQNFIPFSMPNFYVAWKHPYTNETMKSQVIWSGDISTEYPIDYDTTGEPRIITNTSFTYKTWLFAGSALNGGGRGAREDIIHTIINDYYASDEPLDTYTETQEDV